MLVSTAPQLRAAAAALSLCVLAACATNPVTGERELALVSESQEIQMGQQAAEQAAQSIGLVDDQALQNYVQGIGERLARASERPELPWTFRVVDDPTPNAFALPGGFIFVTRGLLSLIENEAELASVLGHEIGHVTARHSVQMISRAQLAQVGLGLGMIFVPELQQFGQVAGAGLQLLFLKYGRDAERQADDLGFRYAQQQNYDVREMPDVFAALQRVGEASGQSPLPAWMSTHPYPEERIQRIQQRLQEGGDLGTLSVGGAEYLQRIDRLVYGENPRQGIFRGNVFLHPDLRFQLTFPQGWRTQNMSQMVVGVSPQQDAIFQLTLAGAQTPSAAAEAFFSQQGVARGQVSRTNINQLPAVVGTFQAQTEQGVLAGIVGYVAYDGRTYQLLGYAPGQVAGRYSNVLQQAIGSFAQLTDPQVLNLQPNRISVVRADRTMTLAEFNQRYPSVIPIEELALINQVESGNSTIPSGTMVKRVVTG